MAVTDKHPSVLKLSRSSTVLLDPYEPESSEVSMTSLEKVIADRRRFSLLAAVCAVVAIGVSVAIHQVLLPQLPISSGAREALGWILGVALTVAASYPFFARVNTIDKQFAALSRGEHAMPIQYVNNMGLNATDSTPRKTLWDIASGVRAMDVTAGELAELYGGDAAAYKAMCLRLLKEVDAIDDRVRAAGLSLDTSDYREDATSL